MGSRKKQDNGPGQQGPWQHTSSWKKQDATPEDSIDDPLVEPDAVVSYVTEEVTEEVTETETEEYISPWFTRAIVAAVLLLVLVIALLFVRNLRNDGGTGLEDGEVDEVVSLWEEVDFPTTSLYTD